MDSLEYTTAGGLRVTRQDRPLTAADAFERLAHTLDQQRGLWLASSYEYPGRYKRYDVGFCDPPLALEARGRRFRIEALNARGALLVRACRPALEACVVIRGLVCRDSGITGEVPVTRERFSEEQRTRRPSVFSVLRAVRDVFASSEDSLLGFYGAFGYDLAFQFEALRPLRPRAATQRDLVLYMPDRLLVVDHERRGAREYRYDFERAGESTAMLPRTTQAAPFAPNPLVQPSRDHAPGEYARGVERARAAFAAGELFEVTPGQVFSQTCPASPSTVFTALRRSNPAPYGFLVNLGDNEFLVGASPEMYVRVSGDRVETCPIAGTIARGIDALDDARHVHTLADYFRQAGCVVTTLRFGFPSSEFERQAPQRVVLSPGPARPDDFGLRETLRELQRRKLPVFGVCLGLQAMLECCGGRLALLALPVHGKASTITCTPHARERAR